MVTRSVTWHRRMWADLWGIRVPSLVNRWTLYYADPLPLGRILVQVTIYRRFLVDLDGRLDQSKASDISRIRHAFSRAYIRHVLYNNTIADSYFTEKVNSSSI